MLVNGFIKLHRSLLKWEWYNDVNTTRLFIHLVLTVNYYDEKWRGIIIKRGQRVSSYKKLSDETKLSEKNIRTALKHLISTGEVAHEATPTYGLFTILNYDKFQNMALEAAPEGQSSGTQAAPEGQQRKNNKKANNANNEKEKTFVSPAIEEIKAYCTERQNNIDAETFLNFYQSKGWMIGKNRMKDWKAAIRTWEKKDINSTSIKPTAKKTKFSNFKERDKIDFSEIQRLEMERIDKELGISKE